MKTKKCNTPGCKNKAYPGRNYCCTCRGRKWRQTHYLQYLFLTIKGNAKRREKSFTLTFKEFIKFCKNTDYDMLKGKKALCLSIDRINPLIGYCKENIRAITISDNSKRARGVILDIDTEWQMIEIECPF